MHGLHYLNVPMGDCSIIQHPSSRITVVNVCNAALEDTSLDRLGVGWSGLFRQPVGEFKVDSATSLNYRPR